MKNKRSRKYLTSTVTAAAVIFSVSFPSYGETANAAGVNFKDVKPGDYFYEAVMELSSKNVIQGYLDGNFHPNQAVTRAQAAKILVRALDLDMNNIQRPNFKDVPVGHWAHDYISVLVNLGILNGYDDDTFRPDEKLTRAQMAKMITLAFHFKEKLVDHFEDVSKNDWFSSYVGALVNNQVTNGTTQTTFSPNLITTRGQFAVIVYRSKMAIERHNTKVQTINEIMGDLVEIGNVIYKLDDQVKSLFHEKNHAILKGSKISFETNGNVISKITYLEIASSKSPNLVLDGKDFIIDGHMIINANNVSIQNLIVKGDLELSTEAGSHFYSNSLTVEGKTILSHTEPQLQAQYQTTISSNMAATPTTISKVIFENSKLGVIEVNNHNIEVVLRGNTTVTEVILASNSTIIADTPIVIPVLTIREGLTHIQIHASVDSLLMENTKEVMITGKGSISTLVIKGLSKVSIKISGNIERLVIHNPKSEVTLGSGTIVGDLVLPNGASVSKIIKNFNEVRDNIKKINGVKTPGRPSGGNGGGYVDRTAPIFNLLLAETGANEGDINITAGLNEVGKVYYVVLPKNSSTPSVAQVKEGKDATDSDAVHSGVIDINNTATPKVITVPSLLGGTQYDVYFVAQDRTSNVQAAVTQVKNITAYESIPPEKISNLSLSPKDKKVEVSWTPSNVSDFARYEIFYIKGNNVNKSTLNARKITITSPQVSTLTVDEKEDGTLGLENNSEYTFAFYVIDTSGNYSEVAFDTSIPVDLIPPTVMGVTDGHSYNTEVTPIFSEGTATLSKDGSQSDPYTSGTTISEEGTYILVVTDEAGNATNVFFTVDKTAPVITGVSEGGLYKEDVTLNFTEGTATLTKAGGSPEPYTSGTTVSEEGNYTLEVTDEAGNRSTVTFTIDKTGPAIAGVTNNSSYNTEVTPTFTEGTATLSTNGSSPEAFSSGTALSEEGTYILVVTDEAGNATTVSFTVDKTAPVITGVSEGGLYKEDVTLSFTEGTATLTKSGESPVPFSSGLTVNEEGHYTLEVTDEAGNRSDISFTIDKTGPAISGVVNGSSYNTEVTPTFSEGTSTLSTNGSSPEAFSSGTALSEEGTYILVVTDEAGNATTVQFSIDRTPPTTTITEGYYNYENNTLTFNGTDFDTAGTVGVDIKHQLNWSKIVWNFDGDTFRDDDVTFVLDDITSAIVTSEDTLTILLEPTKAQVLEQNDTFSLETTNIADTVTISNGFIRDAVNNESTSDGVDHLNIVISPVSVTSKAISNFDYSTEYAGQARGTSKVMTHSNFGDEPKEFIISDGTYTIPIRLYWNIPTNGMSYAQVIGSAIESTIQDYCNANGIPLGERTMAAFGWGDTFNISSFKTGASNVITLSGKDWSYFFDENQFTGSDEDTSKNRTFTVSDGVNTATILLNWKYNDMTDMIDEINWQLNQQSVSVKAEQQGENQFNLISTEDKVTIIIDGQDAAEFF